jgi:hypothetical protein
MEYIGSLDKTGSRALQDVSPNEAEGTKMFRSKVGQEFHL